MRRWIVAALLLLAGGARGQGVLDVPGFLNDQGRALYPGFLRANLPRVFAADPAGHAGWFSGPGDATARAVALCRDHGGTDCRPYAEGLSVVWPGRAWTPPAPPPPLADTANYSVEFDRHFLWRGPAQAAGAVVWSHGSNPFGADARGLQSPPVLRPFNNAGFDILRFDRAPRVDTPLRAAGWLREQLAALRQAGYRRVVVAGESRGGWTSLQMLDGPGLVDTVLAFSPAAHGVAGGSPPSSEAWSPPNLSAQLDDLAAVVVAAAPSGARVAVAQFAGDPYAADMAERAAILGRLAAAGHPLLLIDRPPGLSGHLGWSGQAFADRFADCLLAFATAPVPPRSCP